MQEYTKLYRRFARDEEKAALIHLLPHISSPVYGSVTWRSLVGEGGAIESLFILSGFEELHQQVSYGSVYGISLYGSVYLTTLFWFVA